MAHPLDIFLAEGEHQQQDFKYFLSDARKIARSLAAFANTEGGRLLVGVKDNGTVVGLKYEDEEAYVIEAAAQVWCRPRVKYDCRYWTYGNKRVLEVRISPSPRGPHKAPDESGQWQCYLRRADENKVATSLEYKVLTYIKNPKKPPLVIGIKEERLLQTIRSGGKMTADVLIGKSLLTASEGETLLARLIGGGILGLDAGGFITYS